MHESMRRALVDSVWSVLNSIRKRDQAMPSADVDIATMDVLARGGITIRRALSYDVPSSSETGRIHIVSLYLKLKRDRVSERTWCKSLRTHSEPLWRNEITGARCSCPNRAELPETGSTVERPPCKHIIAALALARLEGYRLEVPKT